MCYASSVKPHKGKLAPRAEKYIFLGFSPGQKSYKLYSLDSRQIVVSRDVIFYKDIYPFQTTEKKAYDSLSSTTKGVFTDNMTKTMGSHEDVADPSFLPMTNNFPVTRVTPVLGVEPAPNINPAPNADPVLDPMLSVDLVSIWCPVCPVHPLI